MSLPISLLTLLFPRQFAKLPPWLLPVLEEALPAVLELVDRLRDIPGMPGPEKKAFVVEQARAMFDEGFDQIPEWGALSEERRDRILGGLAELALFILEISDGDEDGVVTAKEARKSARRLLGDFDRRLADFRAAHPGG